VAQEVDVAELASSVRTSVGILVRRLRQKPIEGDLTLPETSALGRLRKGGPATAADLARQEQISPQSMGVTLAALEARGFIGREADPLDGRRVVLSVTPAGEQVLQDKRSAQVEHLAKVMATEFDEAELRLFAQAAGLIERLAARV